DPQVERGENRTHPRDERATLTGRAQPRRAGDRSGGGDRPVPRPALAHRAVPRGSRSPESRLVAVAVGRTIRRAGEVRRRGARVRRTARGSAWLVLIPAEPLVVGALLAFAGWVAGRIAGIALGRVTGAEDLGQLRIEIPEFLGIPRGAAVG